LQSFGVKRLADLYSTPTLIFQGKNDLSVDWRTVLELAAECPAECIDLHLMMDGDHRLLDRLDGLWQIAYAFLGGRGLV
jgi:predicted alpha/beta-hydrolase family hydrolase